MHDGKGENRMAAGGKGALEYQLIYLCVDAAGPYGEFSGRLVSPYLTGEERFQTVGELMWKVDRLLSRCGMAKRYEERRYFPSAGSPVQIKRDETLTPYLQSFSTAAPRASSASAVHLWLQTS